MKRVTVRWSSMVALGLACSAWAQPPVVPINENLKPAVRHFCAHVEQMASDPKMSKVDAADRATVVIATVAEDSPGLPEFFAQISKLPPAERLEAIKRSFSAATGSEWTCAKFDELWRAK